MQNPTVVAPAEALDPASEFWKWADLLPVAVYACARDGTIVGFNQKAVELWGRKPAHQDTDERFCGAYALHTADRKPMPHAESPMARVLETGVPAENQTAVIERPDGTFVTVIVNIKPVLDHGGRVLGAINSFHAVEPERSEQAQVQTLARDLSRRVAELEAILDLAPVGIGIALDPECRDIRTNAAFAKLLGIDKAINASLTAPPDEMPGFRVLKDGIEVPGEELPMQVAAKTGKPVEDVEFEIVREDGSRVWELGHAAPLLNENGEPRGSVGVFLDITERKRREQARAILAEATAILASSLDYEETLRNIAGFVVPRFADWCAIDVIAGNGSIERLVIAHEDDELRLRAVDISKRYSLPPDAAFGPPRVIRNLEVDYIRDVAPAVIEALPLNEEQRDVVRKVGIRSYIGVPLVTRAGRPLGAMTFVNSASARPFEEVDLLLAQELAGRASIAIEHAELFRESRETAEDLARANSVKDEFLGLVSHELKTPITTILGNASVMSRRPNLTDDLRRQALTDIEHEADRLNRIVNNLLVLARLEQGRRLDLEPLLLDRFAYALAQVHRRNHPWRDVRLETPTESLPVLAEPSYLDQVLTNLLSNAEKYSPPDRPITIRVESMPNATRVHVIDGGPGVTRDEQEKIFAPFYRSNTLPTVQGVGIGLTVCRRLIEAQGGRIWVQTAESGGADFVVELPLAEIERRD